MAEESFHPRADQIGRLLSACCAVHCLVMPLALVLFPFWLGRVLRHPGLHLAVITGSAFLALWSFWQGQKRHGQRHLLGLIGVAVALVLFGELFLERAPWWHAGISASAGFALAWGHHLNMKACRENHCDCGSNQ
jgi:hypothetical protein